MHCNALKEISLPKATEVGEGAFTFCSALTTVSLPACTFIGERVFRDCHALTKIDGRSHATSIPENASEGCQLSTIRSPTSTGPRRRQAAGAGRSGEQAERR